MENLFDPFPLRIYQNNINRLEFDQIVDDVSSFINNNPHKFTEEWSTCPTLTTINVPKDQNINSKILKNQIKLHVNNYFNYWEFLNSININIENLWINIAKQGGYQEEHSHGHSLFSGVIYINVNKDSGGFQFINPLPTIDSLMPENKKYEYANTVTPYNGLILIFPSWLKHRALANKSNQDRISISFNINYTTI